MKLLLIISFIFNLIICIGQTNIESIENPKELGGYVSNPDYILNSSTVEQINEYLGELEQSDHYQVAVVALRSIGEQVPKDFSTELAQYWGVGEKSRDNGLLILLVLDQRRIEFETGYGTETVLTDVLSKRIQQDEMLPYFRDNNYDAGMLAGVKAVCGVLTGQILDENPQYETENEQNAAEYERRSKERERNFWIAFFAWHLFGVAIYLIAILIIRYQYDPYKKYNIIKNFAYWIWAILFPVTHIFLVVLSNKLKERYRNQVRFSGKTNKVMHKLTENEEDEFLSLGQQAEEIVKSVDYDVWVTDEKDDFCILSYRPIFTKYTPCPKCKYRTYYKEYDRISIAPTYSSSGKGEKKYACTNCNHVDHKTYTIPRLQRSSRTSGGRWTGGGGSSGGGSWGGGGSFGGGSFGGGGSGSSW
jgi:uncharacterized protein